MSSAESQGFRFVDPETAVGLWQIAIVEQVRRLLSEGSGEYTERDILDRIASGEFQVWLAWSKDRVEGFAMSHIAHYPRLKKLVVNGAAGANADAYTAEAAKEFVIFAEANGCLYPDGSPAIQIRGRKGWLKKFPAPTWKFKQVVLEYSV